MCDQQILYGGKKLASTIAVIASFVMIAGCATTAKKPTETSEVVPAAQLTAAEQLAADMNNKADARRKADGSYRDPLVHSVNGTRQQIIAQQNQALYPAPTAAPADGQTGIAGLVTQPTGVNANRSSIFSAPPPIAVNPDGTLAKTQPDGGTQAITPMMRSVYSTPPTAMRTTAPQSMDDAGAPNGRTSADMLPPPVIRNATSPAAGSPRPIAQVTASGVAATPNPNVRELNGRQAAALAQFIASKNQPQNGKLLVQPVQAASGQ
ncbi:hypothetical protein FP026_26570 [Rhizobium tropici]|uniref:Uncharacterized protein n=2 Tax=Rhizobium tropici TaxID=398 RepID=A0A5B0VQL9_RHITR|nr:hypothetical protein FP026_26570 [Rhizobium tropici]